MQADSSLLLETLKAHWGYTAFRPLQEDIIRSVCEGNDTLGLMPTGGGKSITFQVPALIMPGLCLVVTPLISLMKDQVDNLRAKKIIATTVYSGMAREEINTRLDNCIYSNCKFLYISPERLASETFLNKLQAMHINLLVVDESHCISQWGYDFRPSYLNIAAIRQYLPDIPVLALTATATPEVVDDIQEKLLFRKKNVFSKSFARKNLSYVVRQAEDKEQALVYLLNRVPGTAIVYVRSRRRTQEIAGMLKDKGFTAHFFHAGLTREEKSERQNRWKDDTCRVIVATNAFGMGIDKPDVRLVVHMDIPSSLEEYFQEAGRAGRDGKQAYAVALYARNEDTKLKKRITDTYPEKHFIIRVYEALGNFFRIAAGYGFNTTYNFSLHDFCTAYKFSFTQAQYALRILELAGYIEYVEDPDNASRLMFSVNREELYRMHRQDAVTDAIIGAILRSYTGVFAEYARIDEAMIASQAHTTRQDVYERLCQLSKAMIIHYIPSSSIPQITFVRSREETRYVRIPPFAYEERKKRDEMRINRVLEYISETNHCRTRMLLRYFGEKNTHACRTCDICLKKTSSGLKRWEYNAVRDTLVELLSREGAKDIPTLANILPLDRDKNITALEFLIAHDEQFRLENIILTLVNPPER
ncbi:MAG: RecQ family ATP-dependent DNA helicase [Tannerella sp.]|jgi:ATP-dependent DNA helicase RecQ|nr:RecQ family ATP-dependent DNA helicase [Tannerella sp.]